MILIMMEKEKEKDNDVYLDIRCYICIRRNINNVCIDIYICVCRSKI
jgi:hypothetical protein